MVYDQNLSEMIQFTLNIDPARFTPTEVRLMIEKYQEQAEEQVSDVVGKTWSKDDTRISSTKNNTLTDANDLYSAFMEKYTEHLDSQF